MNKNENRAHHSEHGGEDPLTNNRQPNQTNAKEVRKQNQQSMQKQAGQSQTGNLMGEEFGSETDVEQVKKQNQQSEAKKHKASGQRANQFGKGFR